MPGGLQEGDRDRIAVRGGPRHVLALTVPCWSSAAAQPRAPAGEGGGLAIAPERRAAGEGLEAADVAASADDRRVVGDLDMADVAGAPLRPAMEAAVRDDPRPDARPDLDDDDVVVARRRRRSATPRGPGC